MLEEEQTPGLTVQCSSVIPRIHSLAHLACVPEHAAGSRPGPLPLPVLPASDPQRASLLSLQEGLQGNMKTGLWFPERPHRDPLGQTDQRPCPALLSLHQHPASGGGLAATAQLLPPRMPPSSAGYCSPALRLGEEQPRQGSQWELSTCHVQVSEIASLLRRESEADTQREAKMRDSTSINGLP